MLLGQVLSANAGATVLNRFQQKSESYMFMHIHSKAMAFCQAQSISCAGCELCASR